MADKTAASEFDALNLITPADGAVILTPADGADLETVTRGIAFGTAGALKVTMFNGDVVTIPSGVLAAGVVHSLRVKRLWATGTTAANFLGVY